MEHSRTIVEALENISKKFGGKDDDALTVVDSLDQLFEVIPEITDIKKNELVLSTENISNDSTFDITKYGKLITINARIVLRANVSVTRNFTLFLLPETCRPSKKAVVFPSILWSNASGFAENDYGVVKTTVGNDGYVSLETADDLLNHYNILYINVTYHAVE